MISVRKYVVSERPYVANTLTLRFFLGHYKYDKCQTLLDGSTH